MNQEPWRSALFLLITAGISFLSYKFVRPWYDMRLRAAKQVPTNGFRTFKGSLVQGYLVLAGAMFVATAPMVWDLYQGRPFRFSHLFLLVLGLAIGVFFLFRSWGNSKDLVCTPEYIDWGNVRIRSSEIKYIGVQARYKGRVRYRVIVIRLINATRYQSFNQAGYLPKDPDAFLIDADSYICKIDDLRDFLHSTYMGGKSSEDV